MASKTTKTNNAQLESKLELRRYFLRTYHATGDANVMDCCQGNGVIWNKLREEFPLAGYWGLDLKPKKGRLKIDSARVLAQPGWKQNVIDIDTYGSPFGHWESLLRTCDRRPLTVFLTIGHVRIGGGACCRQQLQALGLQRFRNLPKSFHGKMQPLATPYCIATCHEFGMRPVDAQEAPPGQHARYIGIRLEPKQTLGS